MKLILTLAKVFKEPLTYFVLLGSLIYYFYVPSISEKDLAATRIELPKEFIEGQRASFEERHNRSPNTKELDQLIEEAVNEEVLFREAWRLNLYVGDEVVRKRMIQKARFILEDTKVKNAIEEPEINQRLAEFNSDAKPMYVFGFHHLVFTDVNKAKAYLDEMTRGKNVNEAKVPDGIVPFPLGNKFDYISTEKIEEKIGAGFVEQLDMKVADQWQGPVKSIYGYHVVKLTNIAQQKIEDQTQNKELARQQVIGEQSNKNWQKTLDKIKQRYVIVRSE